MSHIKIKYMNCNFGGDVQRSETLMRLEVQEIPQDSFQYLGSIIRMEELMKMSTA